MASWVRSVLAVLAGLVVAYVLALTLTGMLNKVFRLDNDRLTPSYVLLNLACTFVLAGLGGYVAARIAERSPMAHGGALAVLLLLLSLHTLLKGFGGQATWYVLARTLGIPVFCLAGAFARAKWAPRLG